ncbi:microtubule-associated protein futsch-like isoform X2 [Eriocheir sinensis]|nr:microtubule-associated protein futsch-like isoform X2 [Eriocheir sinensis]
METRRQSEKVLQKAKEKERAQATRISDEEKRNSAITNAMKNWQVLKRQHRKLVRKPSESSNSASDQPPSKDSDGTTSSGFCGDTVSDVGEEEEEEGKKESAEEKDEAGEEAKADGTKENDSQKGSAAEVVEEQQQQEDDRASLASSATSSGISDVSLVHRATKQRLTEAPQQPAVPEAEKAKEVQITSESVKKVTKKAPAKCVDKTNLPRSKSYTDMRILRRKPSFEEDNSGRVKVARTPEVQRGGCEAWGGAGRGNEKISLEAAPRGALPVQNVPVARRGVRLGSPRAAEKVVPRIIANESSKQGRGSPKNFELLKKSEATRGAGQLPDKVVSAAITRVRSNLSLPVQSPEVPVSPRNAISEPSEIDSSSDAESAATATTTNTAGTPTSSVEPPPHPTASRGPHSLADLRVPLTRPREQERPTSEKADKAVPAVGQSSTGILREQGPNFLAELEGERLSLYGQGALRCTDLAWEKSMAAAATTARFQYINFDDIVDIFPKLRVKFPRLENFIFVETHLAKCSQLNALAELHQVTSLEVGKEGNPLTQIPYWRLYAVFRLSHWGLRLIDGVEVSEEERTDAAVMFSHLSQLAFTCLPRDQLAAFLSSHHHHHGHHHAHPAGDHDPASPPPGGGGTQDTGGGAAGREEDEGPRLNLPHLQDLIGKEALQYRPAARLTQEDNATLVSAGRQARQLAVWTFDSLHRLHTHHATWPSVLHDLVRDAVTDLAKPTYGKQCLEDVKRTLGWKK